MATGALAASGCSPTCPFHQYLRTSYEAVAAFLPTETSISVGTVLASLAAGAALPGFLQKVSESATEAEKDVHKNNQNKIVPSIVSGALFSIGLVVSKMTVSSKIYGFLDMKGIKAGTWDPTLACVMGGGLLVSFLSYQWVKGFNVVKVKEMCYPFFL